ncbi:GAF domain-containing protein [uncultured Pseudoteredinibacter sp.]|uniref:sensor domain-containing diguanylate cyclase n=1 Tax=uncultured Pseudoteredinibacter sp. TaxID=1641701 RepID=UPI00261E16AF|nr:GAF domain-containing protein [uncultured Pseudoteredinibacter sp.]
MINKDQWLLESDSANFCLNKWQKTVGLMAELYDAPVGLIIQANRQGFQYTASNFGNRGPYPAGMTYAPDANVFAKAVVESGETLYVADAQADPRWSDNPEVVEEGFCSFLGMPILWPDGTAFGCICVMDHSITAYGDAFMRLMVQLRDLIEQDLQLWDQFELMREMALKDHPDDMYNAQGLSTLGQSCMQFARRYGFDIGVIGVSVEGLSRSEDDSYEKALATIGETIQTRLRGSDVVARMRDDSFVVVALANSPEEIELLSQRLQEAVDTLGEAYSLSCTQQFYPLDKAPNVEAMLSGAAAVA